MDMTSIYQEGVFFEITYPWYLFMIKCVCLLIFTTVILRLSAAHDCEFYNKGTAASPLYVDASRDY